MRPAIGLLIHPPALARTREALDGILHGWASRRGLSTLVSRVSLPAPIPGSDYGVWCLQLHHVTSLAPAAADLSFGIRATVALHVDLQRGDAAAVVFRDGSPTDRCVVLDGHPQQVEACVARGLAAFAGPAEPTDGWLEPWVARHDATAEVRVIRWNGSRPRSPDWPASYAAPGPGDWARRVDDDFDVKALARALSGVAAELRERLEELEHEQGLLKHDRDLARYDGSVRPHDRSADVERAERAFQAVVREAIAGAAVDDVVERAIEIALETAGIPRPRTRAVLARR
jgi:hypothetical protein